MLSIFYLLRARFYLLSAPLLNFPSAAPFAAATPLEFSPLPSPSSSALPSRSFPPPMGTFCHRFRLLCVLRVLGAITGIINPLLLVNGNPTDSPAAATPCPGLRPPVGVGKMGVCVCSMYAETETETASVSLLAIVCYCLRLVGHNFPRFSLFTYIKLRGRSAPVGKEGRGGDCSKAFSFSFPQVALDCRLRETLGINSA